VAQDHEQDVERGDEAAEAAAEAEAVPRVNATWKRVHACHFESVVKAQLASDICDDAKVS